MDERLSVTVEEDLWVTLKFTSIWINLDLAHAVIAEYVSSKHPITINFVY